MSSPRPATTAGATAGTAAGNAADPGAGLPTERTLAWADTMAGHAAADAPLPVRFAHDAPSQAVGADEPWGRLARQEAEAASLAPGATRALGAGLRARPEEPDPWRTCFERDRDRILHEATAFRRLAGKTQVFIFPDDHVRTRLTHALEVAQVATAIARALRLNVALTEAIALGHDCGHGPGGHASEDAFDPFLPDGFHHATWGADVVLAPLNLCAETLDGVRNHSWSRPVAATPEGEVVSWADRIAYVCHDFEDAVHARVLEADALPAMVRERCGDRRSAWLRTFITGVVDGTLAAGRVAMAEAQAEALAAFRTLNYERIYLRPESLAQSRAVIAVLQALVENYARRPQLLVNDHEPGSSAALAAAVAWVAGMTDRYACRTATEVLDWPADELPQGLTGRG